MTITSTKQVNTPRIRQINASQIWKGCLVLDLIIILISTLLISGLGLSILGYGAGIILSFTPYPILSLIAIIGLQLIDIWIKIFISRLYDKKFLPVATIPPYISLQGMLVAVIIMNVIFYFILSCFFVMLEVSLGQFVLSIIKGMAYIFICWLCGILWNKVTNLFLG